LNSDLSAVTIQMYDMLGRSCEVPNTSIENGVCIDVSSVPPGMYYIRFASGGFVQTRQLCILR
jgi:Secretion system C-terminal sorting domain